MLWGNEKAEREITCPECGEQLGMQDDIYLLEGGDTVVGCSLCIARQSAVEWFAMIEEMNLDRCYTDMYYSD